MNESVLVATRIHKTCKSNGAMTRQINEECDSNGKDGSATSKERWDGIAACKVPLSRQFPAFKSFKHGSIEAALAGFQLQRTIAYFANTVPEICFLSLSAPRSKRLS